MIAAIADAHAAIWFVYADARLSSAAQSFMDDAARDGNNVGVSAPRSEGRDRLRSSACPPAPCRDCSKFYWTRDKRSRGYRLTTTLWSQCNA
jgi:hypothetical protein